MKKNRLIAFALSVSLLLGASACGKPAKTVSELIAEENAILDQHQELWTTALNSLDKDKLSQSTQSTNYADVLDLAIKNVKDQLSDEDYKTLTDDAAKVRKLEDQLQELPPETAEANTASASDTFPSFEGKDLDGNAVDSSLFADNAFTVVNFWFSGCKPCVAELGDLDKLNQTVKAQGGEVIGINTETLDDNADAIATAKQILQTKGASYRNITFAYMSALLGGMPQEQITSSLRQQIFLDPQTQEWQPADEYLSGNVRAKLDIARAAAQSDPDFATGPIRIGAVRAAACSA